MYLKFTREELREEMKARGYSSQQIRSTIGNLISFRGKRDRWAALKWLERKELIRYGIEPDRGVEEVDSFFTLVTPPDHGGNQMADVERKTI